MEAFEKYKVFIIVVVVGLLIAGAFFVLSRGDGGAAAVTLSSDTQQQIAESEQLERELIAELAKLRSIQLNASLFDTPTFGSLIDYSRVLGEKPVGRDNPFAPLRGVVVE